MSHPDPKAKGAIAFGRGNGVGVLAVGADGKVLTADSAQPLGVKWDNIAPTGLLPLWLFGNGMDGSLTLGSDTTLASTDRVLQLTNLDLAGFTLESALFTGDGTIFYVNNTLSLNGGVIRGGQVSSPVPGGAAGGATAGAGGDGGTGRAYVWVIARTIVGTGHIHSDGLAGGDGGNGSVQSATQARALGSDGSDNQNGYFVTGSEDVTQNPQTLAVHGSTPGAGYTGGAGGAGAMGVFSMVGTFQWADVDWITVNAAAPSPYGRQWGPGQASGTGGGGNEAEGGVAKDGEAGGGGAGGGMGFGDGGTGGAGGDGTGHVAAAGNGASGPGGGAGGGSGGFVCVITNSAPSTLTVSADGAAGGKGGNGVSAGGGVSSGGGGGGGGGAGGGAVLIAQLGNGASVTAAQGTGGGAGTAGAGAVSGNPGTDGSAGYVLNQAYNP